MNDDTLKKIYTYVTLDEAIIKELDMHIDKAENKFLFERKSIHMSVKMENGNIQKKDICHHAGICQKEAASYRIFSFLLVKIPFKRFYHDTKNYYAEIYLPLKK